MKGGVNQTETKPYQSNALHPNELVLGRIQAKVRVNVIQGIKPKYGQNWCIVIARKGDHRLNTNFGLQEVL